MTRTVHKVKWRDFFPYNKKWTSRIEHFYLYHQSIFNTFNFLLFSAIFIVVFGGFSRLSFLLVGSLGITLFLGYLMTKKQLEYLMVKRKVPKQARERRNHS